MELRVGSTCSASVPPSFMSSGTPSSSVSSSASRDITACRSCNAFRSASHWFRSVPGIIGRRTARRRPSGRRLPLLCIASLAASPPRQTCELKSRAGSARSRAVTAISGAQRPLTDAGSAWQAEAGAGRAWGAPPAIDSGLGRRQMSVPWCDRRAQAGLRTPALGTWPRPRIGETYNAFDRVHTLGSGQAPAPIPRPARAPGVRPPPPMYAQRTSPQRYTYPFTFR